MIYSGWSLKSKNIAAIFPEFLQWPLFLFQPETIRIGKYLLCMLQVLYNIIPLSN